MIRFKPFFSQNIESAPGSVSQVREVAGSVDDFRQTNRNAGFFSSVTLRKKARLPDRKRWNTSLTRFYILKATAITIIELSARRKTVSARQNEIGIFEMTGEGLKAVGNPSEVFLQERPEGASGSVVTVCMEGTRPMLVEIQALVSSTKFGTGQHEWRRVSITTELPF